MTEDNIRTFDTNWTGTGAISGASDAEVITLDDSEYMESETVVTGNVDVTLFQNLYASGDTAVLKYRHGTSQAACSAAAWVVYTGQFMSLGYVQVRLEN